MPHPIAPALRAAVPAVLALADGTVLRGYSVGVAGQASGEVVFSAATQGCQEILGDPGYSRQLVTLSYPHVCAHGSDELFAPRARAAGLIMKDLPIQASNFRQRLGLAEYLAEQEIVAIAGIDTHRLIRILREKGAQNGAIVTGAAAEQALRLARACPGLAGMDLAREVGTSVPYDWHAVGGLSDDHAAPGRDACHVVAFDYGAKYSILRRLAERGCRLTVLPAQASAAEALALKPDGIFLSNGPGDPQPCGYAIDAARELIERGIPTFGICLGQQIMALASGARTQKMKFGLHGAQHPVQDIASGQVMLAAQHRGFEVDSDTLPRNCRVTHVSLLDGSLQGFARTDKPAFCFQGHPDEAPGAHGGAQLFDRFVQLMASHRQA